MSVTGAVKTLENPARPEGGIGFPRTLGLLVRDKNIHTDTLLATDYLNHFNEIIMLMELVTDMPDCLEDIQAWVPKSYAEHFIDTNFANKDLAILAYENAPQRYRKPFDQIIAQMNEIALHGIKRLSAAVDSGDQAGLATAAAGTIQGLQRLVEIASAIIHGRELTAAQSEIDMLMGQDTAEPVSEGHTGSD